MGTFSDRNIDLLLQNTINRSEEATDFHVQILQHQQSVENGTNDGKMWKFLRAANISSEKCIWEGMKIAFNICILCEHGKVNSIGKFCRCDFMFIFLQQTIDRQAMLYCEELFIFDSMIFFTIEISNALFLLSWVQTHSVRSYNDENS